ncbi:hypothetical protein AEA09_00390 [Lysinibacillus contaminans]|uniref:Uncharacterized protein n=1 Tax=Lysinibacillus contaminans TaxID=1293441 RepID=A0ABR5K5W4_9BACI|nr:hypothetical protein [Lysinibacillus contaminans]KOS71505.1 hypothetical protein AEA09_00390 [Lysinibacillus contaminans]
MIMFELAIELLFTLYTSLGFGTKEYKIETKMEKLSKEYPEILHYYQQNQRIFETDDTVGGLVLSLNLKSEVEKKNFVSVIHQRFIDTV